jgi:hypothetical protein
MALVGPPSELLPPGSTLSVSFAFEDPKGEVAKRILAICYFSVVGVAAQANKWKNKPTKPKTPATNSNATPVVPNRPKGRSRGPATAAPAAPGVPTPAASTSSAPAPPLSVPPSVPPLPLDDFTMTSPTATPKKQRNVHARFATPGPGPATTANSLHAQADLINTMLQDIPEDDDDEEAWEDTTTERSRWAVRSAFRDFETLARPVRLARGARGRGCT